ncbi:MAG: sulfotransferase family protein [Pseudomonadales bacterium]
MGLEVIGAGFGRTGTLSLKGALETLGVGPCYHMMEVQKNPEHRQMWVDLHRGQGPAWETVFANYRSAVDWPSCNFWQSQLQAFPDAKVLLSLRDGESWHRSVMNTIYPSSMAGVESDNEMARAGAAMAIEMIWDGVFKGRVEDKDFAISVFDAHNQAVIDAVPAEQLLLYRPGDGWEPLCTFLDCPVPTEPFPKVNTTEDFSKIWKRSD